MSLEDVNKNLYDKDPKKSIRPHYDVFSSGEEKVAEDGEKKMKKEIKEETREPVSIQEEPSKEPVSSFWEKENSFWKKPNVKNNLKIGGIILGAGLLIFGIIWVIFAILGPSFEESGVSVSIEGPKEAGSGEQVTFTISYKNENRVSLNDAQIIIRYPQNFTPQDNVNFQSEGKTSSKAYIGEIEKKSEGSISFVGKFYGPKDSLTNFTAELHYIPSNFNSPFITENNYAVKLLSSPVIINLEGPRGVASGGEVLYKISYKNEGDKTFNNVRIKMEYPAGFTAGKAVPSYSEGNNVWYVGNLDPGQSGEIAISGIISGEKKEIKNIKALVGFFSDGEFIIFSDSSIQTSIEGPAIHLTQSVNGQSIVAVNAGDTLNFEINFRNDSDVGIRDIIITDSIDSKILDFSKLDLKGKGYYHSQEKNITWKATDFPQLANLEPGQAGKIQFSIPVRNVIPVSGLNDKNFSFVSKVLADSPTMPTSESQNKIIPSNSLEVKLNSKIILKTLGYYSDNLIENSGPVPPQVGKETTYTIHWQIENVSNDIIDAVVESELPSWVRWTGKTYPEDAKLQYDSRNGKVTWNAGKVIAGKGILEPAQEVAFQVSVLPQQADVGKELTLLNPSVLTAKDSFTNESLRAESDKKGTVLSEDASISGGKVVEASED